MEQMPSNKNKRNLATMEPKNQIGINRTRSIRIKKSTTGPRFVNQSYTHTHTHTNTPTNTHTNTPTNTHTHTRARRETEKGGRGWGGGMGYARSNSIKSQQ